MFCLQCGTEAPTRAVTCPACGHDLGRTAADLRASATLLETSLTANTGSITALSGSSPVLAMSGIHVGDLDQSGLPRDAMGRALLIVVIALVADMFLPWRLVYGQHETLPTTGALALVALLVVAAVPLLHPKLRRQPIAAALPLFIGSMCFGLGLAFGIYLAHSNDVAVPPSLVSTPPESSSISSSSAIDSTQQILVSPDFGLFLFLIGALVLVVVGYYLFLAAARASLPVTAAVAAISMPARSVAAAPQGARDLTHTHSHDALPAPPTLPATLNAEETMQNQPLNANGVATTPASVSPQVVLPGSEAWNRAPEPPTIVRPKAGGMRRSVPYR